MSLLHYFAVHRILVRKIDSADHYSGTMTSCVTFAQKRGLATTLLLSPLILFLIFRLFPIFTSSSLQPVWISGVAGLTQYYFSTFVGLLSLIIGLLLWQGLGMGRSARSVFITFGFYSLFLLQLISSLGIPYLLLKQVIHPAFIWALFLSLPLSSIYFVLADLRWTAVAEKNIVEKRWQLLIVNIIGFGFLITILFLYAPSLANAPAYTSPLLYLVATTCILLLLFAAWRTEEVNQQEKSIIERQLAYTFILLAQAEIYLTFGLSGTLSWMLHQPILVAALAILLIPLLKIAVRYQKEKRHRSELTQLIVHDLKSPLTIVISGLELLHRGNLGEISTTQGNLITNLEHCSNEVLRLVDDMLDVERLEEGVLTLMKRPRDVSLILREQISELQILADKHEQRLTLSISEELPQVSLDQDLFRRVIHNLVSNALKFTPNGGRIAVEAYNKNASVIISVADSGPGIPKRERQRIFEKFAQLDNTNRRGKGLGLTFCKMVIDAHDGKLTIEESPYGGSLFKISLPIIESRQTIEENSNHILIV